MPEPGEDGFGGVAGVGACREPTRHMRWFHVGHRVCVAPVGEQGDVVDPVVDWRSALPRERRS
jgi:hypothetical protein